MTTKTQSTETNILARIQAQVHAPKGQRNEFGKFNYRSAEDILAAVKPILREFDQSLVISDEIIQVGDRIYVKATATLLNPAGASAIAYAREPESKKGMDDAQVTGSTSSYARKYALAGLFALDNEKDADTDENTKQRTEAQAEAIKIIHMDIEACETKAELIKLWNRLKKADREAIKDEFTARKTVIEAMEKSIETAE